jgi:hypothetical protein
MRRGPLCLLLFFVLGSLCWSQPSSPVSLVGAQIGDARIVVTQITGSTTISVAGSTQPRALAVGDTVEAGATIHTGDNAGLNLVSHDRVGARLGPNTTLVVDALGSGTTRPQYSLVAGEIVVNVAGRPSVPRSFFLLHTKLGDFSSDSAGFRVVTKHGTDAPTAALTVSCVIGPVRFSPPGGPSQVLTPPNETTIASGATSGAAPVVTTFPINGVAMQSVAQVLSALTYASASRP